jgi:hypothetical protein
MTLPALADKTRLPADCVLGTTAALAHASISVRGIELPLPPANADFSSSCFGMEKVARFGFDGAAMRVVARLITRVPRDGDAPEAGRRDAIDLRKRFTTYKCLR